MKKQQSVKRSLIASALVLCLCFTSLIGTTFAWFTDSATSGSNVIEAGTLDVSLEHADTILGVDDAGWIDASTGAIFNYDKWEPGYTAVKYVKIENEGSLDLKFILNIIPNNEAEEVNLADVIEVYMVDGAVEVERNVLTTDSDAYVGTLTSLMNENDGAAHGVLYAKANADAANGKNYNEIYTIALKMSTSAGNEYMGKSVGGGFSVQLLATQLASESDSFGSDYDKDASYPQINTVDTWDGTADISWYNETDTEFTLSTAEQFAGLAALIDGTATISADAESEITLPVTFDGKIVKLEKDVDLYCEGENGEPISFDPIGYGYDVAFRGTFDGQGHTIFNLYQNGWALGLANSTEGGGLFASVVDATIKNVAIDGAEIVMNCIDMGVLVGYSYGNCTYENISVSNSTIANYQRYTGGVVGEVNGTQTFKNVDVASDVVVSSLWGDFDCSLGGIVGGKYGEATLTFEDCDVACELNTYNDVTSSYQWYAYRRAGMLIGNSEETVTAEGRTSATASYLTATNCTVTYGDWANYTYCKFAGTDWPYVRVQAGNACGQSAPYYNPRYGVATDANGNKAVDDNHVHNDGEDHNILLVFDQLFGGGQGVYGTATHKGVTVTYNNK